MCVSNGISFPDINECNGTPSPCQDICTNMPGSYECSCSDSTQVVTEDGYCGGNVEFLQPYCVVSVLLLYIDRNECLETPGLCQYRCHNVHTGYFCSCPEGFDLVNGRNCNGNENRIFNT